MGLSKQNYTSPGEKIEEKFCFLKKMLFCQSRTMEEKLSPFFSVFFSTPLSKLHSKFPIEHLKGIYFFPGKNVFFHQFGRLRQTFQPFVEFFTAGFSNLPFTCPSKQFEGKKFWGNCVLSICKLERKVLDILCKKIRWVVKATFYVSSRTFSGKM